MKSIALIVLLIGVLDSAQSAEFEVPRIQTELASSAEGEKILMAIKNTMPFSFRIPVDISSHLAWLSWYETDDGNQYRVEQITGSPTVGVERRKSQTATLLEGIMSQSIPSVLVEPGQEFRLEFLLADIITELGIESREGSNILLQAQISNCFFAVNAPKGVGEQLVKTKLYFKRVRLANNQWSIVGAKR